MKKEQNKNFTLNIEKYEQFSERFGQAGLCLFKTNLNNVIEGGSKNKKKINPKPRKYLKHKNIFKNMDNEQKQKLKKYLDN